MQQVFATGKDCALACGSSVREGDTSASTLFLQGSHDRLLAIAGILALVGAIFLLLFRRWRKAYAKREGEEYFAALAEAIPQIVWTAVPGGGIDYCNQRLYELTG
jgi:LPXTG-motif cell wall-anchored protein